MKDDDTRHEALLLVLGWVAVAILILLSLLVGGYGPPRRGEGFTRISGLVPGVSGWAMMGAWISRNQPQDRAPSSPGLFTSLGPS